MDALKRAKPWAPAPASPVIAAYPRGMARKRRRRESKVR
jgi:hypothetical protein